MGQGQGPGCCSQGPGRPGQGTQEDNLPTPTGVCAWGVCVCACVCVRVCERGKAAGCLTGRVTTLVARMRDLNTSSVPLPTRTTACPPPTTG
jgi:hypothetical protein